MGWNIHCSYEKGLVQKFNVQRIELLLNTILTLYGPQILLIFLDAHFMYDRYTGRFFFLLLLSSFHSKVYLFYSFPYIKNVLKDASYEIFLFFFNMLFLFCFLFIFRCQFLGTCFSDLLMFYTYFTS